MKMYFRDNPKLGDGNPDILNLASCRRIFSEITPN